MAYSSMMTDRAMATSSGHGGRNMRLGAHKLEAERSKLEMARPRLLNLPNSCHLRTKYSNARDSDGLFSFKPLCTVFQ